MVDTQSYVDAVVLAETFQWVHDIEASKYSMKVGVKHGEHEEELVEFMKERLWSYTGNYIDTSGMESFLWYTFEK